MDGKPYDGWLSLDIQDMTDDEIRDCRSFFYDDFAWVSGDDQSHDAIRVCDAELTFRRFCHDRYYGADLQDHFRRALAHQQTPLMAFHMIVKKHVATGEYVIEHIQVYEA